MNGTALALALGAALAQASAPPSAPASPDDAVIRNSGSTNTAGYTLVIRRDGSAELQQGGTQQAKTLGHSQTAWLFAKLDDDAPLSSLPVGHCMRSASFGSVTRITYRGETTGDVGCATDPATQELKRTLAVIETQLGIATLPRFRVLRMVPR